MLLLSLLGLAVCLVPQTIVIDTRPIDAHPLEPVSALVLAVALPVGFRNARQGRRANEGE